MQVFRPIEEVLELISLKHSKIRILIGNGYIAMLIDTLFLKYNESEDHK